MNRFTKNQTFLILAGTIIAFAPLCGMMDAIKERLYKTVEKPIVYNVGVYTIDKTAQLISNAIVRLVCITHKKDIVLQKIEHRLNQIEENLKNDEINAIDGMYKEFNVNNDDQQTINSILSQYKEIQKQDLSKSRKKQCDNLESASPEILSFCKQININPAAIEVIISDSPNSYVAKAVGLRASYKFENDTLVINDDSVIYPVIKLYPNFFNLSEERKIAVWGHELTHLALQHHAVLNVLPMEIEWCTDIKQEEIFNSKSWKNLETVTERQAEIMLKDPEWVSIMRKLNHKGYYPDQLFLKHYAQLTEIDELHKLKEKLNSLNK